MRQHRGSTLVESALVLIVFIVILLGIMDFGQILFFHHVLTERARAGARYAAVHAWDVAAVQRYVARNDASAGVTTPGLFGVTPAMVQVLHPDVGTPAERVEVRISSYQMRFLSPWLAGTFTPGPFRAVMPIESGGASN